MKTKSGFRLLVMVVTCALAIMGLTAAVAAQVNVLTQHNDNARTGANLNESILMPSNITVGQFGMLFKKTVDDQVYAQPLYVSNVSIASGIHNVVYVATVSNSVYAFDADSGAQLWHVNFGTPQNINDGGWSCTDVTGNMGIIGTPVIDANSQTLYVVARTNEGGSFFQRLHALDITTGADKPGSPVEVTTSGFSELMQNQRPALLLANGIVYVGEGSHCDVGPYKGYVFGFNATTLAQVGVFNPEPGSDGASLWQTGQGPAADASGNVYFITSNGTWDGVSNFSDSFIKLTPNLALADWFTPSDHATLSGGDTDINAAGASLIPGTNLVVGGGKQGKMYVLNTANMGHLGSSNALQIFQATSGDQFQSSAVSWQSAANGTLVYIWGVNDALKAFKVSNGLLLTTPFAAGPITQSYPGGRLSISANGGSNGIVWAYTAPNNQEHSSGPGVLRAYNADNIATELWNSAQNSSRDGCNNISKNAAPTIANGKVYLPSFGTANSGSGQLCVYGLLGGSADFSLSATPASQTVTPGSGTSYTATVSALNGFTGGVSLGVSGVPAGATATLNPASISGSGTSTLNVSTSSSTPAGTYTLTITGTSGSLSHSASVTLVVNPVGGTPVYQINSGGAAVTSFAADAFFSGGQTDTVTAAINTSGVTNPAPMAVYQSERWGGDSASNPAPFSYTFTKLTAGASYTVRLHFAEIFWTAAGQRKFNVAINGTPVLTNFDIVAAAGAANKAIVQQFTTTATSTGTIGISFTVGTADAPKISGIEIIPAAPPTPDFTLSAAPGSQTVTAGNSTSYSATVTAVNGFSGSVALSVSGVPAGATATFNPASLSGAGSSTLTIATGTAAAGTYPLTITGSSGTMTHSASVTLVINPQPVPDFTLTASPNSQTVIVGNSTSYTATVSAVNGFAGSVALSVSGVPAGATATLNPTAVTGSGTSTLTVASGTAAAGTYPLTITGSSGTLTHSATVTLVVNPVAPVCVTATAGGGFQDTPFATQSGTFTASFDATPAASPVNSTMGLSSAAAAANTDLAVIARFNPAGDIDARDGGAYSAAAVIPYSGGVTYHFRLVVNVATHTYSVFVTAPGGAEQTVGTNLNFRTEQSAVTSLASTGVWAGSGSNTVCNFAITGSAPDFSLAAAPASQTVVSGNNAGYTATVGALNGFSGSVALSVSGVPAGATATFNPASVTGSGTSALTIASGTAATGTYPLTITGTSGSLSHSASVTLVINPQPVPDFTLTASPNSQTVTVGNSTSYTATVNAVNGFADNVALSVSGVPVGATATLNPTSVTGSGASTLTVATGTAAAGTYPLTITGTSGTLTHSASVTLVVNPVNNTPVYQINSGGPAVAPFAADAFFSGGQTDTVTTAINTSGVTNPAPMAVYQSERWGGDSASNPAPFSYTFTKLTAGASYTVRLHFAEIFWTAAGQRKFNVAINGTPVLTNFDIIAAAGAANKAIVQQFTATATSTGTIGISFTVGAADAPKISGIEIIPAGPPTPDFSISATPSSQTITAGSGTSYTVNVGALNGFSGSVGLTVSGLPAGATASFNPTSVTGSGSATLSVSTSSSTPAATSTLTITGASGSLSHSTTVTLVVNAAGGGTTTNMMVTWYGFPDNSPPGTAIQFPQIHSHAGGTGTFADPITFATDPRLFAPGSIVYLPMVKKYFIMEDLCTGSGPGGPGVQGPGCVADFDNGIKHIDMWAGGDSTQSVVPCEDNLTRNSTPVISNPPGNLEVSPPVSPGNPIFDTGTKVCFTPFL